MIGSNLPSRRLSSSTSRTILLRRTTRRRQAACFSALAALLVDGDAEVGLIQPQQVPGRFQVRPEPLQSALLLGRVGDRDFDRAIQPQLALHDFFQQLDGRVQHKVVAQHQLAESDARFLDLPGGRDFVRPREHRNFAHLHQVHADGVVDVRFGAAVLRQVLEIHLLVVLDIDRIVVRRAVDSYLDIILVVPLLLLLLRSVSAV